MSEETVEQSSRYWIVAIVVLVVVLVVVFSTRDNDDDDDTVEETTPVVETQETLDDKMSTMEVASDEGFRKIATNDALDMREKEYDHVGSLSAVDGGEGTGTVKAHYADGIYELVAIMENLPDPEEGYFYEGWIVRDEPFNFYSTGRVEKVEGKYTDTYQSNENYTDHLRYVLTLEPEDGDPKPAGHVVEGVMEQQ